MAFVDGPDNGQAIQQITRGAHDMAGVPTRRMRGQAVVEQVAHAAVDQVSGGGCGGASGFRALDERDLEPA
jgi:hypothetical protein